VQDANPSYDIVISRADGVIQAHGGITSYGYKVCMELEIPIVTDVQAVMLKGTGPSNTGYPYA